MGQTGIKKFMRMGGALILTALLGLSMLVPSKYEARAESSNAYDRTAIEDDLNAVDLSGYPKDENGTPSLITFSEYCYSANEEVAQKYGLYFYVYNPTETPLSVKLRANEINMATSYDSAGEPQGYDNCALTFLDASDDHRFYKFKLSESAGALSRACAYAAAHEGVRRYDFVGLQLWAAGASGAQDYALSVTYRCTGYGAGCDPLGSQTSTLTYDAHKLETIALDIHQTYYRQEGINQNGAGHHNQLSSVYFSINKERLASYGDLYAVKCTWDEAKTAPVIVTKEQAVYDWAERQLGQKNISGARGIFANLSNAIGQGAHTADWGWAPNYDLANGQTGGVVVKDATPAGYVFKADCENVKERNVTREELLAWIADHNYANYLFTDQVDEGRKYGKQTHTFHADEPFDMLSFNSTSSGGEQFLLAWQQFWTGKKWDWGGDDLTIEPIKNVTEKDFRNTDAASASELFVNKDDFADFKKYYDTHNATENVFLLRFAVTDYYSDTVSVVTPAEWYEVWEYLPWADGVNIDRSSTYMSQETVFRQFDIIELTFLKEGKETVIGAVASPVDIIGGIDAPNFEDTGFWQWLWNLLKSIPWWGWLLIAIVVIGLLCLIKPVFEIVAAILKGVVFIIMLPFRAIGAIIDNVSAPGKRKKKKIKKSEDLDEDD